MILLRLPYSRRSRAIVKVSPGKAACVVCILNGMQEKDGGEKSKVTSCLLGEAYLFVAQTGTLIDGRRVEEFHGSSKTGRWVLLCFDFSPVACYLLFANGTRKMLENCDRAFLGEHASSFVNSVRSYFFQTCTCN